MTRFLVDTNVLSEFNRRGQPNPQVERWLSSTPTGSLHVSIITFGEIRLGIELLPPGAKRRAQLEQWLDRDLHEWFADRLLTIDEPIINQWALLMARRQLLGRPIDILDGLLAATALCHNLTVATRNVKDFADLGVQIFNPWEP
jgi:predicted nucleic acid-binding protein